MVAEYCILFWLGISVGEARFALAVGASNDLCELPSGAWSALSSGVMGGRWCSLTSSFARTTSTSGGCNLQTHQLLHPSDIPTQRACTHHCTTHHCTYHALNACLAVTASSYRTFLLSQLLSHPDASQSTSQPVSQSTSKTTTAVHSLVLQVRGPDFLSIVP